MTVQTVAPDFTGLINTAEPYDFEFSGDKTIYDSVLDLTLAPLTPRRPES